MREPALTDIRGVGDARAALLEAHGFTSVIAICEAEPSALYVVPGYKEVTTRILQANARALLAQIVDEVALPEVTFVEPVEQKLAKKKKKAAPVEKAGKKKKKAEKPVKKAKKKDKPTKSEKTDKKKSKGAESEKTGKKKGKDADSGKQKKKKDAKPAKKAKGKKKKK